MENNILVLGGTGKTGSRVVERLRSLPVQVRIGSRSVDPAFHWENQDNWKQVLENIQKVYITFQPDLAVPCAVEKIRSFVETAKQCGVQKLVLLSGRGEKEALACEEVVAQSGLDWTIVRASWFMQNFSENFLLDPILAGHVVLPKINATEPFVDVEDIADVVVAALTQNGHSEKTYELTGPELLSFEETMKTISAMVNRPIGFEEVSMDEYTALLKSYQIPEDVIWLIQYLFSEVLDGRNESLSQDIEKVLGRRPAAFQEYAARAAASKIWDA